MKIKIENLTKLYEKVKAVDNLDIYVEEGELVSILGPSGCGKSTLLYMLAGIVEPTGGSIYFGEEKVNEVPIEKRNIGLVFQNYSLYPHMTVMENLIFPLRMMGIKKKEAIEKAQEISKVLKIEELLKRNPKELSGGQQQRVAIGRALIKKPRILLMDEPFSNLDASLRIEMREEIKVLQKSFSITTLFVTHDQEEALAISDKILLMNQGQAIQYSTGEELYHRPNSIFTASFIGNPKMNIIDKKEHIALLGDDFKEFKGKAIGIRPEDIILESSNEVNKSNLTGIITDVQALGKETHVKLKLQLQDLSLRAVTTGWSNLQVGQTVEVKFKNIHSFEV